MPSIRRTMLCVHFALGLAAAALGAEPVNLLALAEGAQAVVEPPSYGGGWSVLAMLDESPATGWASESGKVTANVAVFELPAAAALERFEFDTAGIDGDGRAARHVTVEISATGKDAGFVEVARGELADRGDGQRLPAAKRVAGRWVRLTLADNHGDASWSELMGFRGYGERGTPPPLPEISGTYESDYGLFHLRRQGTALVGCYEHDEGLLDGAIEGWVMKLTWHESGGPTDAGPALMVFAPDGRSFRGLWWYANNAGGAPSGAWNGRRVADAVGTCPHWSGSLGGMLHQDLAASGRARLYGVLFDLDSANIRPESRPVLDEVVHLLASEPAWKLTLEGHTDGSGAPAHNQTLSEQRAAAVKAYLVAQGVATARLTSVGFGSSRPVADNATDLGRARNRRVELVRE
jgi:outer membrane protein OmpA-like peptidoglycan-associated protein